MAEASKDTASKLVASSRNAKAKAAVGVEPDAKTTETKIEELCAK